MAELPINYGDTGKVARDKINDSFEALEATVEGYRPHIESGIRWIGDTNTGVKAEGDSIVMKAEDGYIWYKSESNSWTKIIAIADLKGDQGNPGADGNGIASITTTKIGKTTTVVITETSGNVDTFEVQDGQDATQGGGDVTGPASSTDGHLAIFDGVTGKKIKDGGPIPSYSASDFDIKDLTDSTDLRTTWSNGASVAATAVQPGDLGTAAACNTGTSSGNVPVLDSNGKLATSTLPGVALTDTFTVSTSSDLTSLSSADQGDIAIATSENKTYVLSQAPYSTAANWKEILAPTGGVTSVNGQTGAVTLSIPTDTSDLTNGAGYLTSSTGVTTFNGSSGAITYTAPVSSVNGSTGAVTVSEFAPGGTATTGYVLTKTANGYEWSAPSGGSSTITVTLAAANWSSKSITVTATGVTASNTVIVAPDPAYMSDYTTNGVYCSAQGSGTLTFACDTEPSNDIDVNVVILG